LPIQHTVEQGEHISRIANEHGFRYLTVWNHSDNSTLRAERKDPNILFPGDVVVIPDREMRTEPAATDNKHLYVQKDGPLKLRIAFFNLDRDAVPNADCVLQVGSAPNRLHTDGNGQVEQEIDKSSENGSIELDYPDAQNCLKWPIKIGHLDPIDKESGWRGRLLNLGYFTAGVDNTELERLRSAVEEFQCDYSLKVDGICGPITQDKLKTVHGC
jgi:N-acetylmuramoyl-L-alanine amidase